jgi:hypothetical protein
MTEKIAERYKQASNLIFVSLLVAFVGVVVRLNHYADITALYIILFTWIFTAGTGFLIRKGFSWARYLLLMLALADLSMATYIIDLLKTDMIKGIIIIVPPLLQVWAAVLVFTSPRNEDN